MTLAWVLAILLVFSNDQILFLLIGFLLLLLFLLYHSLLWLFVSFIDSVIHFQIFPCSQHWPFAIPLANEHY